MDTQVTTTEPPPAWVDVNTVSTSDTNSTIFGKLTSMVRNVRWLYSKLGTEDFSATGQSTVTGALSSLKSDLDGKSNSSHTHSTGTLPVSSNQVNSGSYIPTSALLYSMAQRVEGIQSIVSLAKRELDDPNKRYESKNLGTWSSASDIDNFLSTYTHENNYEGLSLGNYVMINDGTYSATWEVAGFDMEHGQLAADGTVYDNGYGICLIPKYSIFRTSIPFSSGNTVDGAYMSSYAHTTGIPTIITNLKNVFGNHIVNRNVLLSNNIGPYNHSNGYQWTTAEGTLMSVGQMTGTFGAHRNKYDDGEANYRLPVFNYENYWDSSYFRNTRCIWGDSGSYYEVWVIDTSGNVTKAYAKNSIRPSPLIYIR